jgi:outer membrane protein OmpA-like peptidoglycan-associated protein
MAMFKHDTKVKGINYDNQNSSSSRPEVSSVARLRLAVPGALFLLTFVLFGYVISAGSRSDSARFQPAPRAATTGDFSPAAGWIKNFAAKLSYFGSEGSFAQLSGDRRAFASELPTGVPEFVAAAMTGNGPADIRLSLFNPSAARSGTVHAAASEQTALNSLSIEFPVNSAKIPSRELKIIRKAAEMIKLLPSGTTVELIGSAAGTTPSPRGSALAQKRANSVYESLVRAGVDPAKLRPNGNDGSALQAGGSSALEGRSSTLAGTSPPRGRRVEFHVAEPLR